MTKVLTIPKQKVTKTMKRKKNAEEDDETILLS